MLVSDASLMKDGDVDARRMKDEDDMEYVYLHVRHGCVMNDREWTGPCRRMVFCKDICVQQGEDIIMEWVLLISPTNTSNYSICYSCPPYVV